MQQSTGLTYLYDGSFDGLLCTVFAAYARKERPELVAQEENLQLGFGQRTVHIPTVEEQARRVEKGFVRSAGSPALETARTAFLSGEEDKATAVFRYFCRGLTIGRRIYGSLTDPDVLAANGLAQHVRGEAHLLRGFTRFSRMENGVYYGRITPKGSAVPLLMPHFADRFSTQPFLLHDSVHGLAGVYDLNGWYLVETQGLHLPELAPEEREYRRLWREFYETLTIRERYNPKCRMGHMPKRYWPGMTEFWPVSGESDVPAANETGVSALRPLG